jgi:hypothetical protein
MIPFIKFWPAVRVERDQIAPTAAQGGLGISDFLDHKPFVFGTHDALLALARLL